MEGGTELVHNWKVAVTEMEDSRYKWPVARTCLVHLEKVRMPGGS